MTIRSVVAATSVVLLAAALPALAKGKSGAPRLYPYDGYPELTTEERSLAGVPYAEGAPAVLLLEAEQNRWEDLNLIRTDYYRRLKILTDAGVEGYSDFTYTLYGDWRVKSVSARTLLPDGTEVDAGEGVFQRRSADSGLQVVTIAFPQVRAGAILDLHLTTMIDSAFVTPWIIQQNEIPVVKSEFIIVPPVGLKFRKVLFAYDPSKEDERKFRVADRTAMSWRYENVEPLPRVPNRPSRDEIAAKLIIIVDSYKDDIQYIPLAPDWKEFIKARSESIDDWVKARHSNAADLARQVAGEAAAPLAKAEAIHKALRDKVRVDYISTGRIHDSPDEVLAEGNGTTSDLALTAAAMLRAVGVESTPVQYRRRSLGLIPPDFPIPSLLNDTILRIDVGDGSFVAPASDLPAGRLPWYAQGVLGVPLDGKSAGPIEIPDFRSQDNRTERTTTGKLSADGQISAETSVVFRGVASEQWRQSLQDLDEAGQKELVRDRLRRFVQGLQLTSLELRNLDDATLPFAFRCTWEADGYVSRAGQRMLFDPFLFSRIAADDWPPAERTVPIDLGEAYETFDTLTLQLPEGSGEVTLPEVKRLNAGPVGVYEVDFSSSDGKLTAKRHMKLDIYRFPVKSYDSLRRWFVDVGAFDDASVVVSMP